MDGVTVRYEHPTRAIKLNQGRINKALLFIIQEAGALAPGQLDSWIANLSKAGYIDYEQRKQEGFLLPYLVLTEEGRSKL